MLKRGLKLYQIKLNKIKMFPQKTTLKNLNYLISQMK